ncbi:PDZ domain-containing protein [Gracilibacillus lacisalsi]|uniref:PDZ domain-containing protein n=1 Tax=Gracilibacillus lacisalsi TaxID=393087 RepID=UPI001461300F|nr:PDZ domain-containing protein [Gracilibacillus lacisalsi]
MFLMTFVGEGLFEMDWLIEFGGVIVRVFMQPFIYLFVLLLMLSGYWRIKKDRQNFGTKVYPYFHEAKHTWSISIMVGLILSILAIAFGFVISIPFALLLGLVMLIVAIGNRFSWLSAGYSLAIVSAMMYFLNIYGENYLPSNWLHLLEATDLFYIPFIIGILLLTETWILAKLQHDDTYPELVKSSRGKYLGQHRIKKLTIIPFIALVPGGWIEPFAEWPLLEISGESFGVMILPYVFGFEYTVKSRLPRDAAKWLSKKVALLAILILLIAAGSYFVPFLTVVALVVAFLGKEFIQLVYRSSEERRTPYFRPAKKGLLVLGTLPDTPAVDLGLIPGERIVKVNEISVENEESFYQAVNQNRAFCKLSVKDLNGEIRFAQRALYEGEHHKLGILFVKETDSYVQETRLEKQES